MINTHQARKHSACDMCPVFTSCLFADYCDTEQQGMTVGLTGRVNHYPRGAYIGYDHDKEEFVYIVRSGIVRVAVCSPDGESSTFCLHGPRTVLALYESFVTNSPSYLLECLVPVEVCVLRRDTLVRIAERTAGMSKIIYSFGIQFGAIAAYHRVIGQSRAQDRIRLLLTLLQEMGEPVEQGIKLTHEQIATLVHVDCATVTRSLQQLRQEGCLFSGYGNIKVVGALHENDVHVSPMLLPKKPSWGV